MNPLKILLAEIGYRKTHFVLSLTAVVVAVSLFVAGPLLVDAYQAQTRREVGRWQAQLAQLETNVEQLRGSIEAFEAKTKAEMAALEDETRRVMRDMGFNLLITHQETNMAEFWAEDFATRDMPEEYVQRLATDPRLTRVRHLVATLQAKVTWEKRKVLLVGYLPETPQPHLSPKSPMGKVIEPGTVWLGHELGVDHEVGDVVEVLGREFTVAHIQPEKGSKEDITIAMDLQDAQQLLDKLGRINQILALGCKCEGEALPQIRQQLEAVLPETQIVEYKSIALARAEQRSLVAAKHQALLDEMRRNLAVREETLAQRRQVVADMERSREQVLGIMQTLADTVTPLVILGCAVWVGLLALANVRQRQSEIGILRAIGKTSTMVAALFLGKAMLIGLLGAAIGIPLGYLAASWLGTQAFQFSEALIQTPVQLTIIALFGAPLLSALATYLPMLAAVHQDPAVVLREP